MNNSKFLAQAEEIDCQSETKVLRDRLANKACPPTLVKMSSKQDREELFQRGHSLIKQGNELVKTRGHELESCREGCRLRRMGKELIRQAKLQTKTKTFDEEPTMVEHDANVEMMP